MDETTTIILDSHGGLADLSITIVSRCGWQLWYNGHRVAVGGPGQPTEQTLPLGMPASMDNARHRVRVEFENITPQDQPALIMLEWNQQAYAAPIKRQRFGSEAPDQGLQRVPALSGLIFSRLIQYWAENAAFDA